MSLFGAKQKEEELLNASQIAKMLKVDVTIIREWEKNFPQISSIKRKGKHRFYDQQNVELLTTIQHLIYNEDYTITRIQNILYGTTDQEDIAGKDVDPMFKAEKKEEEDNNKLEIKQDNAISGVAEQGKAKEVEDSNSQKDNENEREKRKIYTATFRKPINFSKNIMQEVKADLYSILQKYK